MSRVRARRGHALRDAFPLTVAEEVATGTIDVSAFQSCLASIYARQAGTALVAGDTGYATRRLEMARRMEAIHRANRGDGPGRA